MRQSNKNNPPIICYLAKNRHSEQCEESKGVRIVRVFS